MPPEWATRRLTAGDLPVASALLADAMQANPLHVAVFGADIAPRLRRLTTFFDAVLPFIVRHGWLLGAFDDDEPMAVMGALVPGQCRPALSEAWRMRRVLRTHSAASAMRLLRWLGNWRAHDPETPHWHLGPLAVARPWRRQGIGSALMRTALDEAQSTPAPCWLETDQPANVALYRRLGFEVAAQDVVCGVPCWFMQRAAGPAPAQRENASR